MTRVFGVLGHPIDHSLSPAMHQAAFRALGLDAIYAPFDVPARDLGRVLDGLEAAGASGLNVTVPHKEAVARHLGRRRLVGAAAALGAVNTLVSSANGFRGHNTDVAGFQRVLDAELRVTARGASVVLLGAGGAARAVAWALLRGGVAAVAVANRTPRHATRLIRWMRTVAGTGSRVRFDAIPFDRCAIGAALAERGWLINATSLGLRLHDPQILPAGQIPKRSVVIDLVYRAPTTPLVRAARRRGALATDGLPMLLYQGAEAFRLWWRRPPPVAAMRRAVEQAVRRRD